MPKPNIRAIPVRVGVQGLLGTEKRHRHNICAICDPKITIPITPQFEKEMLIAYT